jgi:hypothetical protein
VPTVPMYPSEIIGDGARIWMLGNSWGTGGKIANIRYIHPVGVCANSPGANLEVSVTCLEISFLTLASGMRMLLR